MALRSSPKAETLPSILDKARKISLFHVEIPISGPSRFCCDVSNKVINSKIIEYSLSNDPWFVGKTLKHGLIGRKFDFAIGTRVHISAVSAKF